MNKPVWKSKTAWAAFGAIVTAAGGYAAGEMSIVEAILAALAGLGAYGIRDAMRDDAPGPGAGSEDRK